MDIKELIELSLEKAIYYDFKDEFYFELKKKSPNKKDFLELEDLEKWLTYKSSTLNIACDASPLSMVIYKKAFVYCQNNSGYRGETLNSYYNPLIDYLIINVENFKDALYLESQERKPVLRAKDFFKFKIEINGKINYSATWSNLLLKKYSKISPNMEIELKQFSRITHTMGNFMPVPQYFNIGRVEKTNDYWDLTLLGIYNYYVCGKLIEYLSAFLI